MLALLMMAAGLATALAAPAAAQSPEWIDLDEFSSAPLMLNVPRTFRVSLWKDPGNASCVRISTQNGRYWFESVDEPAQAGGVTIGGEHVGPFPGQKRSYVMQIGRSQWALGYRVTIVGTPGKAHGTLSLKPDTLEVSFSRYCDGTYNETVTKPINVADGLVNITPTCQYQSCFDVREGGTKTYQISVNAPSTGSRTRTITPSVVYNPHYFGPGDRNGDITFDPKRVTWNSSDWNSTKTITVTVPHDDDVSDETFTIRHSFSGSFVQLDPDNPTARKRIYVRCCRVGHSHGTTVIQHWSRPAVPNLTVKVLAGTGTSTPPPDDDPDNDPVEDPVADPVEPPQDYSDLIAQMREWRDDPKWRAHKAHTDRWDRALLAFGESVADTTLTPMTAAEAQSFADRGWTRWVSVAEALADIGG